MSKHTPGPWKVEEARDVQKRPVFEITSGIYSVADVLVSGPHESHDANDGLARQDAHLIAAAPDMLAELKEIFVGWGARDSQQFTGLERLNPWEKERFQFLKETIAKAEGK